MNLKVVNLVAVQFGMFLGIVGWLAYSQLPFGEPRTAAKVREPMAERMPTLASASNPAEQRSQMVEYRADQEQVQPVAEQSAIPVVLHEYSPAAVQRYSELAAQQYYQQIAPRRYPSSGVGNAYVTTDAPSSAQSPASEVIPAEYEAVPQSVAYIEPTQVVVYQQPQFVAFNNSRRFANRSPSTPRNPGTPLANAHRALNRPRSHLSESTVFRPPQALGVVHRRNDEVPSYRPIQGFRPRGRR